MVRIRIKQATKDEDKTVECAVASIKPQEQHWAMEALHEEVRT